MEEKNCSYVCHLTRTCSFAPYLQWDKIKISYLKWCFCPLWVWLMLFLKGKYWERRSVFFSGLVLYNCARQCQTLLPAEMTLGTRSSCANTAALLSTHLHWLSQIQLFALPWTSFFFFHFSSAYSAAFRSAHELNCQAEQGWQMCYCGYFFAIFLSCEHTPACQLNFSAFSSFLSPSIWRDSRYPFLLKEHHQSQQGGDVSRSTISQLTLTEGKKKKKCLCQKSPSHMKI